MNWEQLLSPIRLGKTPSTFTAGRSPFQQDFDRVVFSSAFRRLQDKAQVFPLAKSDYVRTRLTHSLEASCVGRSLGTEVGLRLQERTPLPKGIVPSDLGTIVATACLAHDIGNPPFGHAGEQAIQLWFSEHADVLSGLDDYQKSDFMNFEGNAQGFRILTRLQCPDNPGMQLTYATLATFTKYPCQSLLPQSEGKKVVPWKKHGFFQTEKEFFERVAREIGLIRGEEGSIWWSRHPLAFLVEAADDICYHIIDLEDGFRLGHVKFEDVKTLLLPLVDAAKVVPKLDTVTMDEDKVGYLRATAINSLVSQVVDKFMEVEQNLRIGTISSDLLSQIRDSELMKKIKSVDREKVYTAREVLEVEVPGFEVLGGLLQAFVGAVNEVAAENTKNGRHASPKSTILLKLIPKQFLGDDGKPDQSLYERLIKITDFISGMTDSYAVSLYKQIVGISLPQR